MQRVRRRWWTWTVSVFAALVILAAGISGIFQLAVMALPDYRDDLSVWITRVAGRPVQIGGVDLVWRGVYPRLDLSNITLFSEDGEEEALTAERLSLGFSLVRLATGDYLPKRIVLSGLSLGVHIDVDGGISVAGFEQDDRANKDLRVWLREFERFDSVRLERCTVDLDDDRLGRQSDLRFVISGLEIDRSYDGFDVDAELQLPPSYGDRLSLEASVQGPIPEPNQWSGDFSFEGTGLMPQPWLRGRVASGTSVAAEEVEAEVTGEFSSGQLSQIDISLDSGALLAERAAVSVAVESMKLRLSALREGQGWNLDLTRFALDGEDQITGQLHYLPLANGAYELNAEAATLHLDLIAPWLQFTRVLPANLLRASEARGEIKDLSLRLHREVDATRYSLRAGLANLALKTSVNAPGFSGLNGEFSATEKGGRFRLDGPPSTIQLPRIFDAPLTLEAFNGELQWQKLSEGWRLALPALDWKFAGSSGRGKLDLLIPQDAADSPVLNLSADFAATDVNAFKPYIPKQWGIGLKNWLTRSVEAGRVARGHLQINGPLADFPFDERRSGQWNLDLEVAGGRLAYLPEWPAAENIQGQLRFTGNSLSIESKSLDIAGNRADLVRANFADFRDRLLTIDGNINGETSSFYSFLRNSPLRETLSVLVNKTRAAGPAKVAVHLDIPLHEGGKPTVTGTVALDGVQLYYENLQEPFNDLRGEIAFDHAGVSAEKVSGSFADLQLAARIEPRAQTHGVIIAEFPFKPRTDGSGVSAYIPTILRSNLGGESRWRAELPLAAVGSELTLLSDLRGISITLPSPLGKSAEQIVPLELVMRTPNERGQHLHINYENRLSADLSFAHTQALGQVAASWNATGLHLQLGGDDALSVQDGTLISGHAAELDLPAWIGALSELFKGAQSEGMGLRGANIHADKWLIGTQYFRDTHAVFTPGPEGWNISFKGVGAEGDVRSSKTADRLSFNLTRMALEKDLELDLPKPVDSTTSAFDPGLWPLMEFSCASCSLNGADYGQIKFNTLRTPGGQKLEYFTAQRGILEASASGEWLRSREMSSAKLKFDLSSPDFTSVMKSLGYAQTLSAKSSKLSGELSWPAVAGGIVRELARGKITLDFDNGTLKAVDPGAGRVLGLLNFYALPRRLTLDFRDVVKSGLAFDQIGGHFALADGMAVTDNLRIDATSLRMEMRGRVGLLARDYDQRVTVYPDVSSGITLGAALVGGPALAALAFIAQEVLDKPIEQATHLTYQLTGGWDNPEVRRIESVPEAPLQKRAPAPATSPRR